MHILWYYLTGPAASAVDMIMRGLKLFTFYNVPVRTWPILDVCVGLRVK